MKKNAEQIESILQDIETTEKMLKGTRLHIVRLETVLKDLKVKLVRGGYKMMRMTDIAYSAPGFARAMGEAQERREQEVKLKEDIKHLKKVFDIATGYDGARDGV